MFKERISSEREGGAERPMIKEPNTIPAAPYCLPRISVEAAIRMALRIEICRNFLCVWAQTTRYDNRFHFYLVRLLQKLSRR
jgi:hypothetical protein